MLSLYGRTGSIADAQPLIYHTHHFIRSLTLQCIAPEYEMLPEAMLSYFATIYILYFSSSLLKLIDIPLFAARARNGTRPPPYWYWSFADDDFIFLHFILVKKNIDGLCNGIYYYSLWFQMLSFTTLKPPPQIHILLHALPLSFLHS